MRNTSTWIIPALFAGVGLALLPHITPQISSTAAPVLSPPAAHADGRSSAAAKLKINLAGKQRMLSQRMAKAVCFASLGVETDRHFTMASNAHEAFDTTLRDLEHGDPRHRWAAEQNAQIVRALGDVNEVWAEYGPVIEDVTSTQTVTDIQLHTIADLSEPVLTRMHHTVGLMEDAYGSNGDMSQSLATAINIAGRQRMLTQRASKQFCLIAAGIDADKNRVALGETIALFNTSLTALTEGDPARGLTTPPSPQIASQLRMVKALWAPLDDVFAKTVAGTPPSDQDIAQIARGNDHVLSEMNRAVTLYARN